MNKTLWHCPNCKTEVLLPKEIKRADPRLWCQAGCYDPAFHLVGGTAKEAEQSEKAMGEVMKGMAQALGSKGGKATSKKYGKEHYRKLAENMNKKRWGK